jgi:hypothetical protein
VAANLFSRSIEGSGVAAEGLPRIVRGFPAKVGILHEATPTEESGIRSAWPDEQRKRTYLLSSFMFVRVESRQTKPPPYARRDASPTVSYACYFYMDFY